MANGRRPTNGSLFLQIEDIGATAVVRNSMTADTIYRIVGRNSADVLKNKNLLDPSNTIAATHITSGGTTTPISGVPGVGDSLVVTAPGAIGWGAATMTYPTSAKGDLFVGDGGSGTVATVAVGANGRVLTADSGTASGVDWKQMDHTTLLNIGTNTHAAIDTHISSTNSAHGLGAGYLNLPLGISVALSNPMPSFIDITDGGAGFNLDLPPMNASNSLKTGPLGVFFIFKNHLGSQITQLRNNSGTNIAVLYPRKMYIVQVTSNATSDGTFVLKDVTPVISATSPLAINAAGDISVNLSGYVDLSSVQSLTNKTVSLFTITGNTNSVSSLATAGGTDYTALIHATGDALQERVVVVPDGTQTLTNKTMDSASNTIQVSGTNINSRIDQDVRTSASPYFNALSITPIPSIQSVEISKPDAGVCQFKIYGGGVVSLLDGVYDVVGTNLTQTLTNKTIADTSNTVTVGGVAIGSLLNQDVRTTAGPQFAAVKYGTDAGTTAPYIVRETSSNNWLAGSLAGDMILRVNNGGRVMIGASTNSTLVCTNSNIGVFTYGLQLPTAGGTPTTLDNYEESNYTTSWSGPWAAPVSSTVRYTRVGRKVTAYFIRATGAASSGVRIESDTVPTRFRPSSSIYCTTVPAIDNASAINATATFDTTRWLIYTTLDAALSGSGGGFSTSGSVNFYEFSLSYSV